MEYRVYKFGGASVKDVDNIKNLGAILEANKGMKTVVVISAIGKMTNALEKVVSSYIKQDGKASDLYQEIKEFHLKLLTDLGLTDPSIVNDITDTFVEVDWILEDPVQDGYDFVYDQIVSIGEILSTKIVTHYLQSKSIRCKWLDVRDLLLTDNSYREAKVNWKQTQKRIQERMAEIKEKEDIDFVITQGFIASTEENFTTTLGREGSDFSAGIFSFCLDAESLTIWKDVPGILNADPRRFENVTLLDRIDYREAIEMTYFGAKVIHPKTIKPLQNKNIPLYVRSFIDYDQEGTIITSDTQAYYPPVIVVEDNQCLMHFSTRDFSFVAEDHLARIFGIFDKYMMKVNMMRNSAISFTVAFTNKEYKVNKIKEELESDFNVLIDKDLQLITIRHYDEGTIETLKKNKIVILEERLEETIRLAVKEIPQLKLK